MFSDRTNQQLDIHNRVYDYKAYTCEVQFSQKSGGCAGI